MHLHLLHIRKLWLLLVKISNECRWATGEKVFHSNADWDKQCLALLRKQKQKCARLQQNPIWCQDMLLASPNKSGFPSWPADHVSYARVRALHSCFLPVTVNAINTCFGTLFQWMFSYEVRKCYVNISGDKVCSHRLRPGFQVTFPSCFTVTITAALPTPLPLHFAVWAVIIHLLNCDVCHIWGHQGFRWFLSNQTLSKSVCFFYSLPQPWIKAV